MQTLKRLILLLLAAALLLGMSPAVFAAERTDSAIINEMLNYYVRYGADSETDIARLCQELRKSDPALADTWESIMDCFDWVAQDMKVTPDILPDGLPENDALCIVVLGYALTTYGQMKDELIGRLEVALASAIKYPNAYILCTGGGTASKARTKTEAGQMAQWLKDHGIAESRIIIENESLSTVQNAQFSCKILERDYPQVTHLAIVSSDYHIPRGTLLFHTQLALNAQKSGGEGPVVAANAGFLTTNDYKDARSSLAIAIADLADVSYTTAKEIPTLSRLSKLEISGEFTYEAGSPMSITATAHYNTGFSRDVTHKAVFSGVDTDLPGEQLLTVTYTENGTEVFCRALVDVTSGSFTSLESQIMEPTQPPVTEPAPVPEEPITSAITPLWIMMVLAGLLAILALLLRIKIRVNSK